MKRNSTRIGLIAAAWAATIFITSCTFIERGVFIRFVEKFIPAGMPRDLWVNFWASFGIFVVKAYHVTEFAVLCYLLFLAFKTVFNNQSKARFLAAAVAALYAASDEWHQTFVPGRGGTWVDVVIDCVGISIAVAIISKKIKRQTPINDSN